MAHVVVPAVVGYPLVVNAQYQDSTGTAIDITSWTITGYVTKSDGTTFTKVASIDNGPGGLYSFSFTALELDMTGEYKWEIELVNDSAVFVDIVPKEDPIILSVRANTQ